MMDLIHYISAKRRLKESEKTVIMMGGNEEAPPMVLAQHEMIVCETDYYRSETIKSTKKWLIIIFMIRTILYWFQMNMMSMA